MLPDGLGSDQNDDLEELLRDLRGDEAEDSGSEEVASLFPPRPQLIGVSAPVETVEISRSERDKREWKRLKAGGTLDRKRKRSAEDNGDKEREESNDFCFIHNMLLVN